MVRAIVGANWGDEGKGKITDMLAAESDIVIRFQGGANAGHTIINNFGRFALHLLPSGVCHQHTVNIIGNGVALDLMKFEKELAYVVEQGVPTPKILISERAQLIMPYHVLFDVYEEERLGGKAFGSTKSGIAPFYSDKYSKIGFQVNELFADEDYLREKINKVLDIKNTMIRHLYNKPEISGQEIYDYLMKCKEIVTPYVANTFEFVQRAVRENKNILLEGQLGSLKDTDFGIYPMVTSSSTLAGYSAVGAGEFVSEIFGDEADELRRRGGDKGEFGATTGRPRRVGWFDCVATRYGCMAQGTTKVAMTNLDVLGYLDEIPVCVGYEIDGQITHEFPVTHLLAKAKPVLQNLPGWKQDVRGIKNYEELPENCRKYIEFIEGQIGFPIDILSNGPGRDEVIYR